MTSLKIDSSVQINKQNTTQSQTEVTSKAAQPEIKDEKLSKAAKYMIGASALAVTIAVGILGHKNNWWRKASPEIKNPEENIPEDLTTMTIEAFNDAKNILKKGVAKLSDGTLYTGKLTSKTKSGNEIVLEYKNGKLTNAQKLDGEKVIYTKNYKHNDEELTEVWKGSFDAAENTYSNSKIYQYNVNYKKEKGLIVKFIHGKKFVQDVKTGKILEMNGKQYFYNPDGSLKCTKDATDILPIREEQLPEV